MMTWFTVAGTLRSGTFEPAMQTVELIACRLEGQRVKMLLALSTLHDHLSSPYSAMEIIGMIFPKPHQLVYHGNVPKLGK